MSNLRGFAALRMPIFSAALDLLGSDCVLCLDRAVDGLVCAPCAASLPRATPFEGGIACSEPESGPSRASALGRDCEFAGEPESSLSGDRLS